MTWAVPFATVLTVGHAATVKAVDTNVLARYVVGDDPVSRRSRPGRWPAPCYISDTVLVETRVVVIVAVPSSRGDLAAT